MRLLPTAPGVCIRRAAPGDLPGLIGMVHRSSDDTLYRRFHGAADRPIIRELERIASPTESHRSWVAVSASGEVRGTATLAWGRYGTVEAAFLVEDAWFRRGVGRALFAAVAREARRAGVETVTALVQADNNRAVRFLRSVAPGFVSTFAGRGELELTLPVAVPRVARSRPGRVAPVPSRWEAA
jgi:GNAT superfamily N-acetyltransferase